MQDFSLRGVVSADSRAHRASYSICTGDSFWRGKAAGAWIWPLSSYRCQVQDNVDLCSHSPIRPYGVMHNYLRTSSSLPYLTILFSLWILRVSFRQNACMKNAYGGRWLTNGQDNFKRAWTILFVFPIGIKIRLHVQMDYSALSSKMFTDAISLFLIFLLDICLSNQWRTAHSLSH
jgi:hypothetical protein